MKLTKSKILALIAPLMIMESCKHSGGPREGAFELKTAENEASPNDVIDFDLNDVSILLKRPEKETASQYLHLNNHPKGGAFLDEGQFKKITEMFTVSVFSPYKDWILAALRIDNCGKILPTMPCQPQIRLVFQPFIDLNGRYTFSDEALHLAYDVEDSLQMYQDFLDLKRSQKEISSDGLLDIHPVLDKQGMSGPYAKRLHELVGKYSRTAKLERIAGMGVPRGPKAVGVGPTWEFAATTEVKDGKFAQTPLPCQKPEDKTNIFKVLQAFNGKRIAPMGSTSTLTPGCPDTDVSLILNSEPAAGVGISAGENEETKKLIKIMNPELTAFASTGCTSCHMAGRFLDDEDLRKKMFAASADAYKAPKGVSQTKAFDEPSFSGGLWMLRAFGWGEAGNKPAISDYTLNDSMRVAHELNMLIESGKLK